MKTVNGMSVYHSGVFERRGEVVVEPERRRISLLRLVKGLKPHARFEVWTTDDGTILLKPLVTVKVKP